jgi:uncharacterized protein (TIGR03437 family)
MPISVSSCAIVRSIKRVSIPVWLLFVFLANSFAQITLNPVPTRAIGQNSLQITSLNPNLVEGREFQTPEGIALDTSTGAPGLYVSDSGNNRVLGFRSATAFANGQHADVVLGQPDFVTTLPQGPGRTARTTGFTAPSGIAVDSKGNAWVVDAANNRILRFPTPFAQTGDQLPDLVIGQPSFSTGGPNQGGISASTLAFTIGNSVLQAFLTFDAAENLWVADAANNRILRFNANVLGSQASPGPPADLVLGQPDFVSNGYNPQGSDPSILLTSFTTPTGIAFDSAGRLFVAESISSRRGRILMWTPPFATGQTASRLLGVDTNIPAPPAISQFQLNVSPGGIFPVGDSIAVVDTLNHRVLVFAPVEQWTPGATFQAALQVAGQPDFASGAPNRGQPITGPSGFSRPGAAAFFGGELYVADSFNNRVVVMPQVGNSYGPTTRVLGQDNLNLNAPNLVEGREFNFTGAAGIDTGLAVDLTSNPPHLYVADTYNNRILAWNDLRNLKLGAKADLVIGQPDFQQTLINYPGNDQARPNSSGLNSPTGLIVDSDGNLYVADGGNGRVLRFPKPFANYVPGTPQQADLVLGQLNFTTAKVTDPTPRTMSQPYGLALTSAGGLLVSDAALNRVIYFQGKSADLKSGMSASRVFGQPDFNSGAVGSGASQLNAPHHIATDTEDRLYVADTGNSRVAIFDQAPTANPGPPAAQFLTNNLSSPRGIYVSAVNGEIWVSDAQTSQAVRYPPFNQLAATGGASNATISDPGSPRAVVEDAWGNLFLADAANRVVIYYPGLGAINAANFLNSNILAPGMIAALFTQGNADQFGGQPQQAAALPLPVQLNSIQVLFNGAPVPLFYADANQINFQVPIAAPQTGTSDLQVVEVATGRVLGNTTVLMNDVDPGLFTASGNGIGAAAALNQDNTINSQTNPAAQGTVITLFGTGQGFIAGAPPDGNISNAQLQSARPPAVIMGTGLVPDGSIQYAGLAPTLVGVWQINVLIPNTVVTTPTNPTQVIVVQNSRPSGGGAQGRPVLIYVKQR